MSKDNLPGDNGEVGRIIPREEALLDIFSEKNLHCHNLREMDSALIRCFKVLQTEIEADAQTLLNVSPKLLEMIGGFLKGGELRHAEGTLVADMEALSREILQKIKKGEYEIGESKQIDGNLRAAVIDKKGKIIKQITLKYADGNKIVSGDINTLAVQAALRQITQHLKCIDAGVQYLITLKRRGDFQTPYFDAVQKIIEAKNASSEAERRERIQSAADDLKHGLNGLYGDLDDCIKTLKGRWIPVASKRNLDYIAEDIVYIPQYVALLSFIYNYQGKTELAHDIIKYYCDEIERFNEKQIKGKYTAASLVHSNYAYNSSNQGFWLDGMKRIQSEIASLELLPVPDQAAAKPVFYLSLEDVQEEKADV